ncbi:MAG: polyprenyl synthetase family protein [Bacteroidota bacterium]|nr:polyprenyl synthetase family protein [Bacteroidota bacterium]
MENRLINSDTIENYILSNPFIGKPENLYNSMNYIMQLGGKRMRPQLLLLAYLAKENSLNDDVLKLALAIETFHNFSLVHDDIMDNAPMRRGKKTVHEEWNIPTAILSGDNLLTKCYELILNTGVSHKELILKEFTSMASLVSDGQQMDMNMPVKEMVTEEEYLKMIEFKTAVLPACALKMGAIAAGFENHECQAFYNFGVSLGLAFQLQDDYLDAFGAAEMIGKQEGGDILENKKTILYIHALKNLNEDLSKELKELFEANQTFNNSYKIDRVRDLFIESGSKDYLLKLKAQYEQDALNILNPINMLPDIKESLFNFLGSLQNRKS